MTSDPSTDVQLRTHVFTTPLRPFGSEGKHWSPCASTLVTGETEAVLTDTGHIKSEVSALGDMIEQWQARFGDDVDKTAVIPEPLEGNVIDLEGQELRVIEVAQGDISPSTVIHIPSIDTVIGGDVVYNRIHMMLALTGPAEWQKWIDSIDLVESLGATTIIAGHKQPDASDQDLETILDGSRGYIRDFRDAVAASSTAGEVIETMKARYPDYGNLTTLAFSAGAAFRAA
jgi:glyoxylase-like metal-dependent hydrolase (beta-lactamase superfamily II)